MQLNDSEQIESIAQKVNFSIFELPKDTDLSKIFPKAIHITPESDKKSISIDQIRDITKITSNKQNADIFVVIERPERLLGPNATNAFLKALEEPGANIHYIFLCYESSGLLPTVRSRANNYYVADNTKISEPPKYSPEVIALAKSYVSESQNGLIATVDKIVKFRKDDARSGALEIISAGIDLMYKSYLLTGNQSFLVKLEKLLAAQDALQQNGHLKLQLIANML